MNSSWHDLAQRHSLKARRRAYLDMSSAYYATANAGSNAAKMCPSSLIGVQAAAAPTSPSLARCCNSPSLAKAADNSSQGSIPGSNNLTPLHSSSLRQGCKTICDPMQNISKEPAPERTEVMKNGSITGLKRQEDGIKDGGSLFDDEPRTMSMRERGTWAGRKTNVQMPIPATTINGQRQQQQQHQQDTRVLRAGGGLSSASLSPSHPEFRCSNCGSVAVLVGHEESTGHPAGSSCSTPRRTVKDFSWQQEKMHSTIRYKGAEKAKQHEEEDARCCRNFHDHRLLEQTLKCKIYHVKGSEPLCKLGHLCQLHHPDCVLANQTTNCCELHICSCGLNGGPSLCRSSSSHGYCPKCTDLCFCCHQHITSSCGHRTRRCFAHNCCCCPGCVNYPSAIFRGGSAVDELLHSSTRSMLEMETFSGPLGYVSETKGISLAEEQMIEEELLKEKRRNASFGRRWWRRWKTSSSGPKVTMDKDTCDSIHCSSKNRCHVCQRSIHEEPHNDLTDEQSRATMQPPKQGGVWMQTTSVPQATASPPSSTSSGSKSLPRGPGYARHSTSRKWRLVKLCHYLLGIPMQQL